MIINEKKRSLAIRKVISECDACESGCPSCQKKVMFVNYMADANIPVTYWFLKMKDFNGPKNVKKSVASYANKIDENFENGRGICFTGQYGTGKTYSICSILKYALQRGYTAYYTSLLDLAHYMSNYQYSDEFYQIATGSDFLAIDEIDSRHFSDSDDAQRYFGSNLERIIRYRAQNALPTLLATNNASLEEVFIGQYKRVIDSLASSMAEVVPALGKDYRKR